MRERTVACLMLLLALVASPAAAQDADALRRELEQMRKSFETMRQDYQRSMEALSQRLNRLEATPVPTAAPPTPGPVAQTPPAPAPSPMDVLRPRQPFTLYGQRSTGQLLFDMGIAGDFVANLTQRNVDKANAGTFPNRENRFFPREIELNLFGQIDPYARGEVRIEAGEEAAGQETGVSLAEANLTLLTLPWGTQVKLGQMRNRYGWSNQIHEHDLPWVDRPGVYRSFLGEEGLQEKGVELTWVPELPFYVEALAGLFNGDHETAFGRGKLNEPLATGRLRTFFELTDEHAIQLGASVAAGLTGERRRSILPGVDVRYKYRPDGWLHPLLTLGGEAIYSIREVIVSDADGVAEDRTRHRFGWYGYGELQPWRRWAFSARYDSTQFPENPGREWAIEPYVTFWPSEFLRFRLGYKHTDRSHDVGFKANDSTARIVDELLFQATFILGAHSAHPF
ncbi:MAG: DUF4200 domain-containing protein [Candidatus Rokubacteria bacterium]|nr:DUF4200 domain-containing protein [Candidatus Rokubacteria bacterium]MBI4592926.1 DUF4200 domain-containing protein [Candidatus Rokubacteria bacterium]